MSVLRLFDVSEYIAAGASSSNTVYTGVIPTGSKIRPKEMPCGGIAFLLNTIHEFYDEDTDLVFCFDRPPTIKRELHERYFPNLGGYKGNRPKKKDDILPQRSLAEKIIRDCGFNVVYKEGYEADDCIASLVQALKDSYDNVIIHSRDSDLFYLVSDNVSIAPVGKVGKYITLSNWETSVNSKYDIKYNYITIHKMIMGESGDNIPAISYEMSRKIDDYIPAFRYKRCGNNNVLEEWIKEATNNDERTMAIFHLIAPLIIDYRDIEVFETEFNRIAYEYYAKRVGNKYYRSKNVSAYEAGETLIKEAVDEYMEEVMFSGYD